MQAAKRVARRASRALERATVAAALAPAPVPVEVARLSPSAELVEVGETLPLGATGSAFKTLDDEAAARAHLNNPAPYGPMVRRIVLVGFVGDPLMVQELELVGRLSAIERTAPDRETMRRWVQVGVQSAMAEGMPVLKQMEHRPL